MAKYPGMEAKTVKLKRSGILTKVIVIILVAYAVITLLRLRDRIDEGNRQRALLEDQADELELENADIQYAIDHSDDDSVKEQIARDELGLVKQGETVYSGE